MCVKIICNYICIMYNVFFIYTVALYGQKVGWIGRDREGNEGEGGGGGEKGARDGRIWVVTGCK